MTGIALKDLLEAGVHFGHQTKRWNPKMKQYIFGERNGIYIIDLAKTAKLFREAEQFAANLAADGRTILFVGTKRQAQDAIAEEAQRCGMFFVNQRWLGGLLTNFTTIQRSLARLRDLEAMETDGRYESLSKKEIAQIEKEKRKLQKNLEGIRHMSRLPDALFVVDTRKEKIAVDEARKLKIPVIGVVDTNCDPDEVDFVIPGNDDALRAIRLFASKIADAVIVGPRHPRIVAGRRQRRGRRGRPRAAAAVPRARRDPNRPRLRRRSSHVGRLCATPAIDEEAGVFMYSCQLQLPASSCRAGSWQLEAGSFRRLSHGRHQRSAGEEAPRPTGAGMMECKAALTEANGNLEAATTILRKRGLAPATKKAGRSTNEGLIGSYIHMGGKIGVLVEVNCESDFVARTDEFQNLAREIAMHIAAASPQYVRREDVPADVLERERAIYRDQVEGNKPAQVIDKIVEGKLNSFYEQVCLLDQPSIRDPKVTIGQLVTAAIAKMGENITITRFVRFKLGEGA